MDYICTVFVSNIPLCFPVSVSIIICTSSTYKWNVEKNKLKDHSVSNISLIVDTDKVTELQSHMICSYTRIFHLKQIIEVNLIALILFNLFCTFSVILFFFFHCYIYHFMLHVVGGYQRASNSCNKLICKLDQY